MGKNKFHRIQARGTLCYLVYMINGRGNQIPCFFRMILFFFCFFFLPAIMIIRVIILTMIYFYRNDPDARCLGRRKSCCISSRERGFLGSVICFIFKIPIRVLMFGLTLCLAVARSLIWAFLFLIPGYVIFFNLLCKTKSRRNWYF